MTDWSKGDQLLFFENLTEFECQILVVLFLVIYLGIYQTITSIRTYLLLQHMFLINSI